MRRVWLILRKDLLVLRRSPVLLALLVTYPLVIAGLVGLVAAYASSKPRVALVDQDDLPDEVVIAGNKFHIERTIDNVSENVNLVRLEQEEAERQLATGKVVAVITVPPGFVATLKQMVTSPELELQTTTGGVAVRVRQQVQALVYSLNRELQDAFIEQNLEYVELLRKGGEAEFVGVRLESPGLAKIERALRAADDPRLTEALEFLDTADQALELSDEALRATANPIELVVQEKRGRSTVLSAQVQAYGLALSIAFLALVLAAGALAAERDENVLARLSRGLVRMGELVWAKVALAAVVATALGLAVALVFGAIVEIGDVPGGEPWGRLPVLVVGLALAGAALGALGTLFGALAREARTASLAAVLVVLPIVFIGLVPREVAPAAGWISDALPFAHAVRYFGAALYDLDPWWTLAREALWLAGLGAVFVALARLAARRLVA